ncbi:MAG: alpha/beta hydrolase [Muribaculaceae bacterium]|nr:alpha/beta hydrolase [Muribaculaceae bacterium]
MRIFSLMILMALTLLPAGAQAPSGRMNAEAAAFVGNLPAGLQASQEAAVRKAIAGDHSALEAVRAARNVAFEVPADIAVTDVADPPCRIYRPASVPADTLLPLLIYLHGGGWCFGSINSCAAFCVEFVHRSGMAVMAVDYPLAPGHPWPSAPEACSKAVDFVFTHAAELGFDAGRVSIGGDSAGGNLALSVALGRAGSEGGGPLESLILFYPVVKVWNDGSESWRDYGEGFGLDGGLMDAFNEAYLAGRDPHDPLISPFCASGNLLSQLPPVLMVSADCDILRDQAVEMCLKLSEAGVDVAHRILPGTTHLFITVAGQSAAFDEAVGLAAGFVRRKK